MKDHPTNPRILSKKAAADLVKSFKKNNYVELVVIDHKNTIVAGHQRVHTMQAMGWGNKEIEVRVPNRELTQEEIDGYLISSNKITGEFDFDLLANTWDVDFLCDNGFSLEELGLEAEDPTDDGEEDSEIQIPDENVAPKTKLGDIYELNGHRLICGDSTDKEAVLAVLQGVIPIIMVTDPPYGVNYNPSWRQEEKGSKGAVRALGKVKNDDIADWTKTYELFPGHIVYVWHGAKHSAEVARNLEACNYEICAQIIWAKQHFALSRGDYHWKHEPCWYAVKKGANHNWKGDRKQTTIWEIANLNCFGKSKDEDERTDHSTQKPLACMSKPILNHTDEEDYVYDPFLGSGTTLIACEKLNRRCLGIELSPIYCDMIVERFKSVKNKKNESYEIKKNGEIVED